MNILAKVIHGSRLYGLHNESSDYDYKSLFLPTLESCLLIEASQNNRSKDDENEIENEGYSLQKFLKLCRQSESIVIDMLHCSDNHVLETSSILEFLRENKSKFYTKKMAGSLNFSKTMALKYGYRADRMEAAKRVYDSLKIAQGKGASRLYQCWDDLPDGEYIYRSTDERNNNSDNRIYEVAGKKLQATITVEYAVEIIEKLIKNYGDRVRAANEMGGSDFKAISHSFRVGYQLYHIYKDGGFSYPLPETEFLKDVKFGRLNYVDDKIDEKLNNLITEVENLSKESIYPNNVDKGFCDDIILKAYNHQKLGWRS